MDRRNGNSLSLQGLYGPPELGRSLRGSDHEVASVVVAEFVQRDLGSSRHSVVFGFASRVSDFPGDEGPVVDGTRAVGCVPYAVGYALRDWAYCCFELDQSAYRRDRTDVVGEVIRESGPRHRLARLLVPLVQVAAVPGCGRTRVR
ncbi:hypothetical protein Trydic_g13935 [Trypoxylus dichotomus]